MSRQNGWQVWIRVNNIANKIVHGIDIDRIRVHSIATGRMSAHAMVLLVQFASFIQIEQVPAVVLSIKHSVNQVGCQS